MFWVNTLARLKSNLLKTNAVVGNGEFIGKLDISFGIGARCTMLQYDHQCVLVRDVEAVEYFLLLLPTPYKVSRFRVCFHFQFLSSKCFRFHIPAPSFMKNASASSSSKSQMLPRLLLLPASSIMRNQYLRKGCSPNGLCYHSTFHLNPLSGLLTRVFVSIASGANRCLNPKSEVLLKYVICGENS